MNPRILYSVVLAIALNGCATVALEQPAEPSYAYTDTSETTLGREVAEWTTAHDGLSGFYPLVSGLDAFGVRLALIESAEKSIDAQYFLMKPDIAGHIFAGALLQAADRGVRVRFLLDDVFTTTEDVGLLALDQHPNIDVRLFNPIARSGVHALNFVGDFKHANRRMHNKSFTVDNQITVIGGRNIADEYFELNTEGEFLDFDMLGVGQVAANVSNQFDLFWNHERAIPLDVVTGDANEGEVDVALSEITTAFESKQESVYLAAMNSPLVGELYDDIVALYPAKVEVITDLPGKLTEDIDESQQVLVSHLADVVAEADSEVIVITPYFVPLDSGVAFWGELAARGIKVTVLTNSLASNNHIAVHSGYAKYRKAVVQSGVELYEMRASAVSSPDSGETVTLHTKAVLIDREFLYVGSLNLDPRSIAINSEMGAIIRSPHLAGELAERVMAALPEMTYRVELDEKGKLQWRAVFNGTEIVENSEPLSGAWRRIKAFILRIVPDSQL